MIALGIEGTAHTCGVGIVDDSGNILANEIDMYRPATGGIHPREAANHHAEKLVPMVKADAYGLGVTPVAKALERLAPLGFGVATVREVRTILDQNAWRR